MTANRITIDAAEHRALLARLAETEERAARAESEGLMSRALVAALGDYHEGDDVVASVAELVARADRLKAEWDAAHDALWSEHRRGSDIAAMARAIRGELRMALQRADRMGEKIEAVLGSHARTGDRVEDVRALVLDLAAIRDAVGDYAHSSGTRVLSLPEVVRCLARDLREAQRAHRQAAHEREPEGDDEP